MNFGLNKASVRAQCYYQYMNMQSAWRKKHAELCHFGIQSHFVTQYLRLVVEVKTQHRIFGESLKEPQDVLLGISFLTSENSQISCVHIPRKWN